MEEHKELRGLVERKFERPGDVQRACTLVLDSQGLERTKDLAAFHAQAAADAACVRAPRVFWSVSHTRSV